MASPVLAQLTDLSDRALLILILERQQNMSADISALQNTVVALQGAVAQQLPLVQRAVDLGTQAIAALETLIAQVAANATDAAAIQQITADAGAVVAQLQAESASISTSNDAVKAELDKITPPTTP